MTPPDPYAPSPGLSVTAEFSDAPLAPLTTMRVGGSARRLVVAAGTDDLVDAVREVDDADEPLFILGGGSNVVLPDAGVPGTVVRIATSGITVESIDHDAGTVTVRIAAGEDRDSVVERAVAEGWSGIEALSGIPGVAGSTPVQNVGAYGQDVASTIASVRVWDRRDQRVETISGGGCDFGYRHSIFKTTDRYVVLDVLFSLVLDDRSGPIRYAALAQGLGVEQGARVPLAEARAAVLEQRRRRGMVLAEADHDTWSCGSFFTNPILSSRRFAALTQRIHADLGPDTSAPRFELDDGTVKTNAAWLIEQAGFEKGFNLPGPAALSTKHVLAVTNRGGASAAQIVELARQVRDGVAERFGVVLHNEPIVVGDTL